MSTTLSRRPWARPALLVSATALVLGTISAGPALANPGNGEPGTTAGDGEIHITSAKTVAKGEKISFAGTGLAAGGTSEAPTWQTLSIKIDAFDNTAFYHGSATSSANGVVGTVQVQAGGTVSGSVLIPDDIDDSEVNPTADGPHFLRFLGSAPVVSLYTDDFTVTADGGSGAPLTVGTPTVGGTAQVGRTVTAKPGTWTAGTKLGYQWLRNGAAINGATTASYAVTAADAGTKLSVTVTGSKDGYEPATKTSAQVTVKAGTLTAVAPTISGSAKVAKKLTARAGSWTAGTKLGYQWLRNGKSIKGATKSAYTPVTADAGKKLSVKVTGSKAGYVTTSKTSAAKKVAKGTLTAAKPKVKGKAKVGKKLTAKPGKWTKGTKLHYQWYAAGKKVKGATHAKLKLTKKLKGKKVWVKVTGTKSGYKALVKTSKKTAKIKKR